MLRVTRQAKPPSFFDSKRVMEERKKILNFLRRHPSERSQRRDNLDDDIFFDPELISILRYTFDDKCAFCEAKIGGQGRAHHFRPLRFAHRSDVLQNEYYLWLAFEWRNIFYVCDSCDKSKAEAFPLENSPADFLASYESILRSERTLLINPSTEEPFKSLRFRVDGSVVPLTPKGHETIRVFRLDREELKAQRVEQIDAFFAALRSGRPAKLEDFCRRDVAFFGAVLNVMQRIASSWIGRGISLSSGRKSSEEYVREFVYRWKTATMDERSRLGAAIEAALHRENDDLSKSFDFDVYHSGSIDKERKSIKEWYGRDVSSISIRNFKAIRSLQLTLPSRRNEKAGTPALMILGENSVGKSSILAAIALAAIGGREAAKLRRYFPELLHSSNLNHFDQLDNDEVNVKIDFHFDNHQAEFAYSDGAPLRGAKAPSLKVLAYGPRRFFDPKKRKSRDGAAARVITLFDPLATIPYPDDWLRAQTGGRFNTIAAALRIVLALNDEDELIVDLDSLAVRANGRVTPINSLSQGYRSIFAMTVDIIRELLDDWDNLEQAEALVLIDELETHLHPRWKMQVMTSLRRVFPRVQFIVTTHDPLCLRGMDDGEVIVLQRDEDGQIYALDNLPSVKGMTAEQLFTSDYFGLSSTTDASTEIGLAALGGDVVRTSIDGDLEIKPSTKTVSLIQSLVVGDSPTEQVLHEALVKYLEQRETSRAHSLSKLREEAVAAVVGALTKSGE